MDGHMGANIVGIFSECQIAYRKTLRSEFIPIAATLSGMSYDPKKLRLALAAFLKASSLKESPLEKLAEVGEGTIRAFRTARTQSMTAETWDRLAAAASRTLKRRVSTAELRGEVVAPNEVPLSSYLGAGDEILPIEGDGPIDYVPAPPGMTGAEATEVRGLSMIPLYHPGDLLFHRRIDADPTRWLEEVVAVQVRNGKRYVKQLLRGKRGRFTLKSFNPAFPAIEDQLLDWVGPIEWVHKKARK